MSFFLGLFPDEKSVKKINELVVPLKEVFVGFDIPVRWVQPKGYHMTLIHFGEKMSFLKKILIQFKLKKLKFCKFRIRLNSVKLGISKKYKELIYVDILEGGEETRKLFADLREILNLKKEGNFLPHITLGRVSKELSDQEYSNVCKDFGVVVKNLRIGEIEFFVEKISLVKSEEGCYSVLMSFNDSSNMKS